MNISIKRTINAPSDALWDYLADYSNIHKFHPLLKGSDFVDGAHTCELGSTRQCDMKDGSYLKERITDWKEGSHYSVEIYETSMPVKEARATIGVKAIGENQSEAYMYMNMKPKYKLLQPMMYLMFQFFAGPSILRGLEKIYRKEHTLSLA